MASPQGKYEKRKDEPNEVILKGLGGEGNIIKRKPRKTKNKNKKQKTKTKNKKQVC